MTVLAASIQHIRENQSFFVIMMLILLVLGNAEANLIEPDYYSINLSLHAYCSKYN
jgi:hypothetical protein